MENTEKNINYYYIGACVVYTEDDANMSTEVGFSMGDLPERINKYSIDVIRSTVAHLFAREEGVSSDNIKGVEIRSICFLGNMTQEEWNKQEHLYTKE